MPKTVYICTLPYNKQKEIFNKVMEKLLENMSQKQADGQMEIIKGSRLCDIEELL